MSTRLSDGAGDSLISQDRLRQDMISMDLAPGSEGNKSFALGFSPPLGTVDMGIGQESYTDP